MKIDNVLMEHGVGAKGSLSDFIAEDYPLILNSYKLGSGGGAYYYKGKMYVYHQPTNVIRILTMGGQIVYDTESVPLAPFLCHAHGKYLFFQQSGRGNGFILNTETGKLVQWDRGGGLPLLNHTPLNVVEGYGYHLDGDYVIFLYNQQVVKYFIEDDVATITQEVNTGIRPNVNAVRFEPVFNGQIRYRLDSSANSYKTIDLESMTVTTTETRPSFTFNTLPLGDSLVENASPDIKVYGDSRTLIKTLPVGGAFTIFKYSENEVGINISSYGDVRVLNLDTGELKYVLRGMVISHDYRYIGDNHYQNSPAIMKVPSTADKIGLFYFLGKISNDIK